MVKFITLALLWLTLGRGDSQIRPLKVDETNQDSLQNSSKETTKVKLRRIINLEFSGKKGEALDLALDLVGSETEFENGAEIEALYSQLKSLRVNREAKEFLLKKGGAFPGAWRLQFLRGTVLEREGKEKESRAIFRTLLKAKGEIAKRNDFNRPINYAGLNFFPLGRKSGVMPPELRAAGWDHRVLRTHHPAWGGAFHKPFERMSWLPESVAEVRAMSFCNLARQGDFPEGVEGIEYPKLLAALCRGDGSFEVKSVARMLAMPEDFRLKTIFLEWVDSEWSKSEKGRERIWNTVVDLAKVHPGPAIELGGRFFWGGVVEVERWNELALEYFGEAADVSVVEAVAGFSFASQMLSSDVTLKRSRSPELKERLLQWVLSDHGGEEPIWLPNLVHEFVEESRIPEIIKLINRYALVEESEQTDQPVGGNQLPYFSSTIRYYEHSKTTGTPLPMDVVPFALRGVPTLVIHQVISNARQGSGAENTAQAAYLTELAEFYPEITAKELWTKELAARLDEIVDPVVRFMLASAIKVEDVEKTILELEKSDQISHRMIRSWLEENRGNFEKAFALLAGIEREDFSEEELKALDQRMAVAGAFRFGEIGKDAKGEARGAWTRLVKREGGEVSADLRKLAPLLGLEDQLPKLPDPPEKKPSQLTTIARLRELFKNHQLEKACELAASKFPHAEGRQRREILEFVESKKFQDQVLEVMRVKAKSARATLALARLAGETKRVVLAEGCYRKVLEEDPKNFEAHLGLVVLQDPDKQDFGLMVFVVPFDEIQAKIGYWVERVSNNYQINVREEIAVLGLLEELMGEKNEGRDLSFAVKFLIRKEAANAAAIHSGIGTRLTGEFPNWKEIKGRRERELAQLMLERPKFALKGFAKLHANRKEWGLTAKELMEMAKVGIGNELREPKFIVNGSVNWIYRPGVPATFLWGAEEYLRAEVQLRDVLDEEMMLILEEYRPENAKSLKTAARLVAADEGEAEGLFQEWLQKLPEDSDQRRLALLRMADDVLVYRPAPAPWMNELEKLWLKSMAGAPYFWSFKKEIVARWFRWRVGQGDQAATGFVERVLVAGLGPKESWPILTRAESAGVLLPMGYRDRLTHVKNLIGRLFELEGGRRQILVQMFKYDLVKIYGRDQLAWLFRVGDWNDPEEELIGPFVEDLHEFARFTASQSGDEMAECGLFLLSLKAENQVRSLMHQPRSWEVMRGEEWHPRLRTWTKFLVTFKERDQIRLLDQLLEEKLLLQEMMAIDEEVLMERLHRHLWTRSGEVRAKFEEVRELGKKK